jgi:hypothetical protein
MPVKTVIKSRILAQFPLNIIKNKHHEKRKANKEDENVKNKARDVTQRTINLVYLVKILLA